jgi:hypothetical protein
VKLGNAAVNTLQKKPKSRIFSLSDVAAVASVDVNVANFASSPNFPNANA